VVDFCLYLWWRYQGEEIELLAHIRSFDRIENLSKFIELPI
jgi:hypothetical protein